MKPALLWKPLPKDKVNGTVQCRLCNHFCRIEPDSVSQGFGICGVRKNIDGELFSLVADKVAAVNIDPVEKKPLYHFMPGTMTYSFGTMGCNLSCTFCQNYSISQPPRVEHKIQGREMTPEEIVKSAIDAGCRSISYTYNEPTMFYELMLPTAKLAVEKGLKNIIVSNGFMSTECLDELGPYMHAANIDLKAYNPMFYREYAGARLQPVLDNLQHIKGLGWWLEVTTLVIPGLNDSLDEFAEAALFIKDSLGSETPWHVSRFHPTYKMTDRGPTPTQTLEAALHIGKETGLHYVYIGNVPGHPGDDTCCPKCGRTNISRRGFSIARVDPEGRCAGCGSPIGGVGMDGS